MNPVETGREHLVTRAFVSLADTLVDEYDVIDLLDRLVGYSVQLLAADAAGIVLADAHGELRAVAASGEDAQLMELLQLQSDQGPCLDCVRSGSPVTVIDLTVAAAANRWPVFAAAVADGAAFRSVHALPLRLRREAIGALNLFHHQPGPLPSVDLSLGQALADVATIGILSERAVRHGEIVNEQLQSALLSRVIIEQAKGVLTEKGNLSMDAAFDRLRRYARNHNLRLSDVARQVVETDIADEVVATPTQHTMTARRGHPRR